MHSLFLPTKARTIGAALAISAAAIALRSTARGVPMEKWPVWAMEIYHQRQPQDTGVGDTVIHLIGDTRLLKFKTWFKEKIGRNCGCSERQNWLNARYPYAPAPRATGTAILSPLPKSTHPTPALRSAT